MSLIYKVKLKFFQMKWKKDNPYNQTVPTCAFLSQLVSVGQGTYGGLNVLTYDEKTRLAIGHYCSIGPGVAFIPSADHYLNHISTYPFLVKTLGKDFEGVSKGDIIIDDDVWIGYGATILSGVHIGQGAVIAAGAVVTKDVPPYAVVAGVPAKVIKYRFRQEVIDYLLTFNYQKLDQELVREHIQDLYLPMDQLSMEEIRERYAWFPKKLK